MAWNHITPGSNSQVIDPYNGQEYVCVYLSLTKNNIYIYIAKEPSVELRRLTATNKLNVSVLHQPFCSVRGKSHKACIKLIFEH